MSGCDGGRSGPDEATVRFSKYSSTRVEPGADPAGPVTDLFLMFSDVKTPSTGEGPALRQESGPAPPAGRRLPGAIAPT